MIEQECIGIPDMIFIYDFFVSKKIKIKAEIVLSPGGAYFWEMITVGPTVRYGHQFLTNISDDR